MEVGVIICNGMAAGEALIVCVLDEPVLRWVDVGCTAAMPATTLNPYGLYDTAQYLLSEHQ